MGEIEEISNMVIDGVLELETLKDLRRNVKVFAPLVESEDDMMFGWLVSFVQMAVMKEVFRRHLRIPDYYERQQVRNIILQRAEEIKARIRSVKI